MRERELKRYRADCRLRPEWSLPMRERELKLRSQLEEWQ